MADDLLDNDTVQMIAGIGAAAGAIAFGAVGLVDTNVLVDTAGLSGQVLTGAYGAFVAAGAAKGWNAIGEITED
ncbi:hypothetical protein [Salinarchaeum laminariae]|uniref:hypothetical protein n=1 Tax=Salinarchaeum laminariae TaxID=869888 RepID=UPI0020BF30BD|nr:hypothetical protein [Salinarchaeum laminariae]